MKTNTHQFIPYFTGKVILNAKSMLWLGSQRRSRAFLPSEDNRCSLSSIKGLAFLQAENFYKLVIKVIETNFSRMVESILVDREGILN